MFNVPEINRIRVKDAVTNANIPATHQILKIFFLSAGCGFIVETSGSIIILN